MIDLMISLDKTFNLVIGKVILIRQILLLVSLDYFYNR